MYKCKEHAIATEIIVKYHKRYKRNNYKKKDIISNYMDFKVERLVEESLANVGGYEWVDKAHFDFSDLSDSKTASISINPSKAGSSYCGEITNVSGKMGALRVVIWNPHKAELLYYFLPKSFWENNVTRTAKGFGKITFTYNVNKGIISRFNEYRVKNFYN